jgi:hypothetical protein
MATKGRLRRRAVTIMYTRGHARSTINITNNIFDQLDEHGPGLRSLARAADFTALLCR